MTFKTEEFQNANLQMRQKEVHVPELPDKFFEKGAEKKFTVRQLSGNEMAICNEEVEKLKDVNAILAALMSGNSKKKAEEIKALIGMSDDTRAEIARGAKMIELGLVDPVLPHDQIIRLGQFYFLVFKNLYREIARLTGQGAEAGE